MMKFYFAISAFLLLFGACTNQSTSYQLTADEFETRSEETAPSYLIDVRTADEFNGGHIQNAQNIDWTDAAFGKKISELDISKPVFIYCLSGGRSSAAADYLRESGFKNVYELEGGMLEWRNAGKPETSGEKLQSAGITQSEFNEMIISEKLVIVDFYAPWCMPCKRMEPALNEISVENKESVKVIRIDIDQNKALAASMEINSIPFLVYYRNCKKTGSHTGEISKKEILSELNL